VALLLVVLGCSADEPEIAVPPSDGNPSSNESDDPGEATNDAVLVAVSAQDLEVWDSPEDSAPADETLSATQQTSGQVVCVVVRERGDDWLEVALPTAPAGHTGWVKRADVTLSRHRFRIEVSRSDHTLTLYTGDTEALHARVAIGTGDSPEAGARLFIKDLVKPPNPGGPYAGFAYGLSGSANNLAAFQAGRGVVAIHGAADPSTLGRDVPVGSIAVDPDVMTRMVETYGLPLGTPVDVVE
jgi:lipoprotein-anchoring transpeptidase ErfK/SrfK